ncbi:hypothetical protein [Leptospira bandrabouensis]|uniref:Uncharacterized protein n=1 Tax=Leptospira bandrabouensis TaxID=2484903 RepID=A0A6H3NRX6_9LEPT|nr:hypothetical protein [Leptospira bandrabouensis]MCG6142958.1 hypothetical protein [Leptospira bandrabouensis]MCG6152010.1 hypothetical protein [Leptospira bandrabouensis]MCG6158617.1 hypothetical protein [Leptospira bandrabouensis]MCG6162553.1 hypothetical protein [Leptospira bandrabouensis]TGN09634.1 hypothetical protein EHR07_01365 [Leptospira bandrabouensis]
MTKTYFKNLLLLILGILTINCLNFRSGEYEGTPIVKKFGISKNLAVKVNANYQMTVNGEPDDPNDFITQRWQNESAKLLNESEDVFYTRSQADADYIFDIKVIEDRGFFSAKVAAWISLPTLGILPYFAGSHISMNLAVKDKKGKVLAEMKREENKTEVGQILLLFVMPFADPSEVIDKQRREMLSSVFAEIKEKGYLKK